MYWSSYLTSTEKKQESDQWNKLTNFIFNSVKLRNKHSEYTVYFLDFFVIFLLELHHKKSVYLSVSLTLCKKKTNKKKDSNYRGRSSVRSSMMTASFRTLLPEKKKHIYFYHIPLSGEKEQNCWYPMNIPYSIYSKIYCNIHR